MEEGGETVFPLASPKSRQPGTEDIVRPGMEDCSIGTISFTTMFMLRHAMLYVYGVGLAVVPTKADAVLFYNRLGDMRTDPASYHGGCPPMKGQKWAANSWIWNVPSNEGMGLWSHLGM